MNWLLHNYYADKNEGLISKLLLSDQEKRKLKSIRRTVRERTREVFKEAREVSRQVRKYRLSQARVLSIIDDTTLRHLSDSEKKQLANLLHSMEDDARDEFESLEPRFWTQGSFQYDTLNQPYSSVQEMDIDDGTYLPMTVFESEPKIGHELLLLLVDSSLKSLTKENPEWTFEAKQTCGRIKIPNHRMHIDVPMYAIPKEEFYNKQLAFEQRATIDESLDYAGLLAYDEMDPYELDSECVNLALRDGAKRWTNSDPKVIEDWFKDQCLRIGAHLKLVCRFLKAWRDAQWPNGGGPSSISLMAAAVNILNKTPNNDRDLGQTMKTVALLLPKEYERGIESPDSTDENPLFPPVTEHGPTEQSIMDSLNEFYSLLTDAELKDNKKDVLSTINLAYGERVTNAELIRSRASAPAISIVTEPTKQPNVINSTMTSG